MDGYAVRSADVAQVPVKLRVVGEVAAGHPFEGTVSRGEAARIFTGGVLPPGTDAIVIQENTAREDASVVVTASAGKGKHVRVEGLDFKRGEVLLPKGRRLSDRDLALAAAMNHPSVPVRRRPTVAVLATGDELVMPGASPGFGEIVYSNGYATAALAHRVGCRVADLGIVPDRLTETAAAVRRARDIGADILVTSGGASVGDYDLVQKALAAEGLALSFWKVALRPGRPMMHGRLGAMHVLGLPGNPVSAYVCGVLFLVPLIRRLAGRNDVEPMLEIARLGCALPQNDERADYLRATLSPGADGVPVATPASVQDSSMLVTLAQADCLVVRAPHEPAARAGDPCSIIRLAI
jgi:molybdopterin molybdotransferase